MNESRFSDVARQFATIFAAIFQVYASYVGGDSVGDIAQENRSLILPAGYAFSIWGPIFILCGIYAIYQALPAQRENRVYRAAGWWVAGAFLANGVWIYVYTAQQFVLAQAVIIAGFVCAVAALVRFARESATGREANIDAWIVAPAFGLLAGWLTAASIVGLAGTLVAQGLDATGTGAEFGAAALLLAGGGIAFAVVLLARRGPAPAWIAYGAAVLWALVAIVVEQREASLIPVGAAVICMALVLAALLGPWSAGRSPQPRVTG